MDSLLKYFLYLVLEENSQEKRDLDKLQDDIEKLQHERYYLDNSAEEETERNAVTDDDVGSEERKKIKERDEILVRLFLFYLP